MFSNWFSGNDRDKCRTSPYKQRIDRLGSSLLELRYAGEVIRQHLHEWLRFSLRFNKEGASLPGPRSESVRQYLDERVAGRSASRSRVLRASDNQPSHPAAHESNASTSIRRPPCDGEGLSGSRGSEIH